MFSVPDNTTTGDFIEDTTLLEAPQLYKCATCNRNCTYYELCICRATMRPPRPSSTAECLRLIARLRGEQASAASWEPRPPFEAAEMD